MTKEQALQLFASHVDVSALLNDFPEIDWVITELRDGQQEIIIRLQGADPDFYPAPDIASIEAMTMDNLPDGMVKNSIVLRKHKANLKRERLHKRDLALLKRNDSLIAPAGISGREFAKVIRHNLPVEEVEL